MSDAIYTSETLKDNADDGCSPIGERGLSDLAIAKLRSSGISKADAMAAGIYSVENAKTEVHGEFAALPALVFPYYDVRGNPIFFERDGEILQFVRLRYLVDFPDQGFKERKPLRYVQYRGSGVHAYFAKIPGYDWSAIAADPSVPVAIVEGELKALKACIERLPTIGICGVNSFLRKRESVDQ